MTVSEDSVIKKTFSSVKLLALTVSWEMLREASELRAVALPWQQPTEGCRVFCQVLWVTTHMVQTHMCTNTHTLHGLGHKCQYPVIYFTVVLVSSFMGNLAWFYSSDSNPIKTKSFFFFIFFKNYFHYIFIFGYDRLNDSFQIFEPIFLWGAFFYHSIAIF